MQITYKHPVISQRITDQFHVDFLDFYSSVHVETDLQENTAIIKKGLEEIKSGLSKISGHLENIAAIGEATGLRLSLKTLINLRYILTGEDKLEKLNPYFADTSVFREVLDADIRTAHNLAWFFRRRDNNQKLSEVEGVDEQLLTKLVKYFSISDDI